MTEREKRLLILLLGALFVVINFGIYAKVYAPRVQAAEADLAAAQARVAQARNNLQTRDLYEEEMVWVAENEPEPTTEQRARTQLQQIAANFARSSGLNVVGQNVQETVKQPGSSYHRARIRVRLQGAAEQALYSYLVRLHSPKDFRAVTLLKVTPQKDDDTKVDCEAMIEQWFVPGGGTTES